MRTSSWVLLSVLLLLPVGCSDDSGPPGSSLATDGRADDDAKGTDKDVPQGKCKSNEDCEKGTCNPMTGICLECTGDKDCEEGMQCIANQCVEGLVCEPGKATCEEDSAVICNEVGTAYLAPQSCDDGIDCTEDSCSVGVGCIHVPDHSVCEDDNDCTKDACDPAEGCLNEISPECEEGGIADPQPPSVVFPPTVPGEQMTQENVLVHNSGLGDLTIFSASVKDEHDAFRLFFPPSTVLEEKVFVPPLVVSPEGGASISVVFIPEELGQFSGILKIKTNDATKDEGLLSIPLQGTAVADNCVMAIPQEAAFGPREIGTSYTLDVQIKNCGDGLVPIYELGLATPTAKEFSLLASLTAPFDLDVGTLTTVTIGFAPTVPNMEYKGILRLKTGAPKTPKLEIPLSGTGVTGQAKCPVAVITYGGKSAVPPHIPVSLSGTGSYALAGAVKSYVWEVEQPTMANTPFDPSATSSAVKLTPKVCGEYLVKLKVWDEAGNASCNTATQMIKVLPSEEIYVELLWNTPGDPNQFDEGKKAGADLDLHVTSPKAEGPDADGDGEPDGWFDTPYDCYWGESNPDWGSPDPKIDDNPLMSLMDLDGAGPEVVTLNNPADGTYKIGVHYFNDHGFGNSLTKVRVYAHQGKALETDWVELTSGDMWDVARLKVSANGAQIKIEIPYGPGGQLDITPDYTSPLLPWD